MKRQGAGYYKAALREASKDSPNFRHTLQLLHKAIDNGSPDAGYALGTWYLHGEHVKRNLRKAIKLFKQAATRGVADAEFDLAVCYEVGVGVRQNAKLAVEQYLKAALHGDKQAVYEMGRCYYHGIGVENNRRVARVWLGHAKALGIKEPRENGIKP